MEYKIENGELILDIGTRVDSANADSTWVKVDEIITKNTYTKIIFDFTNLAYISSAGLRVLLKVKKRFDNTVIDNVSVDVYEILDMTGFTEMMEVNKALRVFNVDGCPIIGKGAKGTVYRFNDDTIVKVYNAHVNMDDIKREISLARKAFILGVPTAITFDIVKVGNQFGSVFELLKAKSFTEMINENKDQKEKYIKMYADVLRQINTTDVSKSELYDYKEMAYTWLDMAKERLSEKDYNKIKNLVDAIEDRQTMIHGDFHTNNLLYQNGEAILIDMDTLAHGHPIFELANIYITYIGFGVVNNKIVEDFLGIDYETSKEIWKLFLPMYLDTNDEERIKCVENKVKLLADVRLLRHVIRREKKNGVTDESEKTIQFALSEIDSVIDNVDDFDF